MAEIPRRLVQWIAAATVLRLIVAGLLEFGNDEAYYFLYALDLQPNYFDHPPGVALLIRLTTLNLWLTDEFFVRLGAIACSAAGTVLIYRLGTVLKNEQTGWFAVILYTANFYTSLIAGTFIIPDSPQVVAWLGALLVMHSLLTVPSDERAPTPAWVLFGVLAGVTVLCKVHGVFLWVSLGLYILLFERKRLKDPGLYISAVVTAIIISPILIWNIQNDFITFRFHGGRVEIQDTWIHLDYFFQAIIGQLIYSNPVNAVLIILAAMKIRQLNFLPEASLRFVLVNGLPLIVVVTVMSLFNQMLPHWSGPGVMVLTLLAAAWLDEKTVLSENPAEPRVLRISIIAVVSIIILTVLVIQFYPGTFGDHNKRKFGDGDFTLDLNGWGRFSKEFQPWLAEQERSGKIPQNLPIVSNKWYPAAHIEYYVATPIQRPVLGVGNAEHLHHYAWLNRLRPRLEAGDSALCIVPSNYPMIMENTFLQSFESAYLLKNFYSYRSGLMSRYFTVYLLIGYKKNDQVHQLPYLIEP